MVFAATSCAIWACCAHQWVYPLRAVFLPLGFWHLELLWSIPCGWRTLVTWFVEIERLIDVEALNHRMSIGQISQIDVPLLLRQGIWLGLQALQKYNICVSKVFDAVIKAHFCRTWLCNIFFLWLFDTVCLLRTCVPIYSPWNPLPFRVTELRKAAQIPQGTSSIAPTPRCGTMHWSCDIDIFCGLTLHGYHAYLTLHLFNAFVSERYINIQ